MKKIVECVPNISEGRDRAIIDACTGAAAEVEGCNLLDVDPGADTNRTVITLAGDPDAVLEGAFQLISMSHKLIDMSKQTGAHPRAGATDVCPFVPVADMTMDECVELAKRLGERVGSELDVPVYLYEFAATKEEWRNLAEVRKGEYEALPAKMKDPAWKPDFGPHEFRPKFGAVHISARKFLVAYNINLNTRYARFAKDIALAIREKGHLKRDENREFVYKPNGKKIKVPGLFRNCKAAGWYLDEFNRSQVTMNLTDIDVTAPHQVFDKVCELGMEMGVRVTGSEIVGLIPLKSMLDAGRYYLQKQNRSTAVDERELVRVAVESTGLDDITKFDPDKKIVEYVIAGDTSDKLVAMSVTGFNNELASESPAPGGGSVAALAGSLAASLATMVSNLTHGKIEYRDKWDKMESLGVTGQELKDKLLNAIDDDTDAFNAVMAASRMPKKTEEQEAARQEAVDEANKDATRIPYSVCEMSLATFDLIETVARFGNQNSVSDAGVAAYCAHTGVHGAALNVRINLPGIEDEEFKKEMRDGAARMTGEADSRLKEIVAIVDAALTAQAD
ncbi:MAG: glutamate formimidoyltransferase [Candidatus Electryonea clarkiae]|nr:glutamate formimidoyltransferase [Candidatus Electryonea clarkiae]MDP8288469.1 glutamate formimidoyltransferase [Candidatus Electryonea clarkiae]